MTLQQPDNQHQPLINLDKIPPTQRALLPILKFLSPNNPVRFAFYAYWILFKPNMLKAYKVRLTVGQRATLKRDAVKLATGLIWLPMLFTSITIWLLQARSVNWLLNGVALVAGIVGWSFTYRYSERPSSQTRQVLLLVGSLASFALITAVVLPLYNHGEMIFPAVLLMLVALLAILLGLCTTLVFRLPTLELLAGLLAMMLIGGATILATSHMVAMWVPLLGILFAILFVGMVEEKHELNGR